MPYQQQGGRYPPRREQEPPSLPAGYLEEGYFDEKGNIRCELITQVAERVAQALGDAGVTTAQLRRFFAQVRSVEREMGPTSFPELIPQIQRLKPMAANYVGRGSNRWEREGREVFKQFIDRNVALAIAGREKGFKQGFVPHFESVVAYYAYYKYRFSTK